MQIKQITKKIGRELVRPFWKLVRGRVEHRIQPVEQRLSVAELQTNHVPILDRQVKELSHRLSVWEENLGNIVLQQSGQRAELVALANRQIWVEETIEAVTAAATAAAQEASRSHAALESGLQETRGKLDALSDAQTDVADQIQRRADRDRIFLSWTQEGLFLLKDGELISEVAARDGCWDSHILWVATQAAEASRRRIGGKANGRAVDAGAHFGLISIPLARRFDHVTSFEPNEFNATLLRANAALNGVADRIDVRRAALFSRETQMSLARSEQQEIPLPLDDDGKMNPLAATNLGAYRFAEDGSGLNPTQAFALDSFGLDDLAFLKVDAQGADGEVLNGAWKTIETCHPWIVFEWEDLLSKQYSVSLVAILERIKSAGYVIQVLKQHNDKQVDYLALPVADAADYHPWPQGSTPPMTPMASPKST